ncbi:hypothetical protein KFK09_028948 [Dendrobium nobile]|uniref:Uncharacterized protein n=1 Tax=Dendrobium nobile TaxID=94219 RepID=A0A8T3A4F3_DENNO|nr:hypothetical protein KFK09_028948 [Dendrobium nobile]
MGSLDKFRTDEIQIRPGRLALWIDFVQTDRPDCSRCNGFFGSFVVVRLRSFDYVPFSCRIGSKDESSLAVKSFARVLLRRCSTSLLPRPSLPVGAEVTTFFDRKQQWGTLAMKVTFSLSRWPRILRKYCGEMAKSRKVRRSRGKKGEEEQRIS